MIIHCCFQYCIHVELIKKENSHLLPWEYHTIICYFTSEKVDRFEGKHPEKKKKTSRQDLTKSGESKSNVLTRISLVFPLWRGGKMKEPHLMPPQGEQAAKKDKKGEERIEESVWQATALNIFLFFFNFSAESARLCSASSIHPLTRQWRLGLSAWSSRCILSGVLQFLEIPQPLSLSEAPPRLR